MNSADAKMIMWLALALLCGLGGLALSYALWRLGRMLRGVEGLVFGVTDEVVPVIGKVGTSVDTVNLQLQKVDIMMDSAVDITESVDTSVRAVSMAVSEPVKYVASALSGVTAAVNGFAQRLQDEDDSSEFGSGGYEQPRYDDEEEDPLGT